MNDPYFSLLQEVIAKAYAPYSRFPVAAVARGVSGTDYSGVNVENAAYPVGSCAEAAAIAAMIGAGGRKITRIAVAGRGDLLCTPCGGCRQRIREFAAADMDIFICDEQGLRQRFTLAELLPHSFGPDNLG